jgi:hypothetical protein
VLRYPNYRHLEAVLPSVSTSTTWPPPPHLPLYPHSPLPLQTTISTKWQTKVGALQLLGDLAAKAPDHVAVCLPDIVPAVTDCAVDVKEQLKTAATEALTICCGAVGE